MLPLSAIDHIFATDAVDPIQVVLRFAGKLDTHRVVEAFSATSQAFHGAGATLVQLDDANLAFDLRRTASRIDVRLGRAGAPVETLVDPVHTALGVPLTRALLTELPDETALGLSMSHVVADGYGFLLFLAAWAARARGAEFPQPNCDRALLAGATRSVQLAGAAGPLQLGRLKESGFIAVPASDLQAPRLQWIERTLPLPERSRMSNDLLSATLWKECAKDATSGTTTLTCPVDIRKWMAGLGPLFFGNAILMAPVSADARELHETSVERIAGWIRASVLGVPARIAAAIAELEGLRASHGVECLPHVRGSQSQGDVLVSNLSRAPLTAFDFGTGPATTLEAASLVPRVRSCLVLRAEGALRLLLALPVPDGRLS